MDNKASADIVIFGGGVAGLWLLNRLRDSGLSAILFESNGLGGGQTNKSQGIIHGGLKYALKGVLTSEAKGMSDMPQLWQDCLSGKGELDLSQVPVLSKHQYLWSPGKFASRFTGMMASAALSSQVDQVDKEHYPAIFKNPGFKGEVYALNEMVIDVPVLMRELMKANQDAIYKIEPLNADELKFDEQGNLVSATICLAGKSVEVEAQQFVFTAGAGNEIIINRLASKKVAMQLRPLHMVMMKTRLASPLYAHCMGLGKRPRITITTHYCQDGAVVWYMGGMLAENGIHLSSEEQIKATRAELKSLFPWMDFADAEFASFIIDRAEPKQAGALKPESSSVQTINNVTIGWPTKLVLAPKLAQEVLDDIRKRNIKPALCELTGLRAWPMPAVAPPIWETMFCKPEN